MDKNLEVSALESSEREEVYELYKESGLSKAQFAKDYGLNYKTFCNWSRELEKNQEGSEIEFVEVDSIKEAPASFDADTVCYSLLMGEGLELKITGIPDTEWLAGLIRKLRNVQ